MRRGKRWLVGFMGLTVVFWNVSVPAATAKDGGAKSAKSTALRAGKAHGTVIDADRKTPVKGVTVKAYGQKSEKPVLSTVTDKKGRYSLKKLKPGRYRVVVADSVVTEVTVMKDGEIKELDFRIPSGYLPSKDKTRPKRRKRPGTALVRFALVTVGVGAAVAVPFVVGTKGSGDDAEASPSS